MNGVTLITPTGGRPEAFQLCEFYISRQTYHGPIQWLCSDDCKPRTEFTNPYQEVIYPPWTWKPGANTQAKNLELLLEKVQYDFVLFIEDDEWYSPFYIEAMLTRLEKLPIVGEGKAKYYNVQLLSWYINRNTNHACLARTGIRSDFVVDAQQIAKTGAKFIDIELWKNIPNSYEGVFFDQLLSVGIKGMPGRSGIGSGHKQHPLMQHDPQGEMLKNWIQDDFYLYFPYLGTVK